MCVCVCEVEALIMTSKVLFTLFSLALLHAAVAQPFVVTPAEFEPEPLEAMKRMEDNYTGFVFDFNKAPVRSSSLVFLVLTLDADEEDLPPWCLLCLD